MRAPTRTTHYTHFGHGQRYDQLVTAEPNTATRPRSTAPTLMTPASSLCSSPARPPQPAPGCPRRGQRHRRPPQRHRTGPSRSLLDNWARTILRGLCGQVVRPASLRAGGGEAGQSADTEVGPHSSGRGRPPEHLHPATGPVEKQPARHSNFRPWARLASSRRSGPSALQAPNR